MRLLAQQPVLCLGERELLAHLVERGLVRQVQLLALALMRHLLLEDRAFELCHVSS